MHQKITVKGFVIVLVMSISLTVGLNNVLLFLDLAKYSKAYQEAVEVLYAPSLIEQILFTGILIPIVEELIFRGLLFKTIRKWLPFVFSMVISAVLFGLYHGNLVQFVYATICGLMLAYLCERFQSVIVPICAHIVMNLVAVLFTEYEVFAWMFDELYRMICLTAFCTLVFIVCWTMLVRYCFRTNCFSIRA